MVDATRGALLDCHDAFSLQHTVSGLCNWSQGIVVGCSDGAVALARSNGSSWAVRFCGQCVSIAFTDTMSEKNVETRYGY
jgi:hypothetical protein